MTNPLLSAPYVEDILYQPKALRETLAAMARSGGKNLSGFAQSLRSGRLRRIVLTGMGSSYHGLHPLYLTLIEQGFHVQWMETSELIHHAPSLIMPDTLVVAVSQSGSSAEIVRLLERTGNEVPVIGVTNTQDSPLASGATEAFLTFAGPEHSVSCKTYLTALVILTVIGEVLKGGNLEPVLSKLQMLPEAVAHYLASLESNVDVLIQRLEGVKYLVLVGRGRSLAATGAGSLIIKEAARFPAEGMSCAAFRHGPMEMASPEVYVLVYEGTGQTSALNAGLVADIQKAGGRSVLVGPGSGDDVFRIPPVSVEGLPVLEILPAQMLSLALALQQGHAPGQFVNASKVTSSE